MWHLIISSKVLRFLTCYLVSSSIFLVINNVSLHPHVPIPAFFVIIFHLIFWPLQLVYLLASDLNFKVLIQFAVFLCVFTGLWILLPKLVKQDQV
jgi:hypothetical protein